MPRRAASLAALAAVWVITGCASMKPPADLPGGGLITYETSPGPFCGRCDTLKLTVASDGRVWIEHGWWAGAYSDWTINRR